MLDGAAGKPYMTTLTRYSHKNPTNTSISTLDHVLNSFNPPQHSGMSLIIYCHNVTLLEVVISPLLEFEYDGILSTLTNTPSAPPKSV